MMSFVSVSASQACGFPPLMLKVSISAATIAQLAPPSSLPAKSAFFQFNAIGRMLRSFSETPAKDRAQCAFCAASLAAVTGTYLYEITTQWF
jgi:hypothetical protein